MTSGPSDPSKRPVSIDVDTLAVHAGEPAQRWAGAVAFPIFQSAAFLYPASSGEAGPLTYGRMSNTPNHKALHQTIAQLENTEAALVTSSGMAAISMTLLSLLQAGDHILVQSQLYGGTHDFLFKDLPALGITCDQIDLSDPSSWEAARQERTRCIYIESISNPLMEIAPLTEVAQFAKEQGLVSIIDNTFASPINLRPIEWGIDLCLHSATKYLNGHSDVVAGAVAGRATLIEAILTKLNHMGGTLDPHACFLLQRGIKTLALRVRQQNQSALAIASYLHEHEAVTKVNYPGLPSHPQHALAQEQLDGFGGMLSFELKGGKEAAKRFLSSCKLALEAVSLGGVETLFSQPVVTSHVGMTAAQREAIGISDGLIRMSVGIESQEALLADLSQALDATKA